MIVQETKNTVIRTNTGAESAFGMNITAQALNVLSSSLYSNGPAAIVRELACNAYDSHVESGRKHIPIQVHLPCIMDSTLVIRDEGMGLSDFDMRGGYVSQADPSITMSLDDGEGVPGFERVGGIYNTYFKSTKQLSNEVIGQIGLGSKSPFSYGTTFNVEAIHDGVRRYYACFKNEKGFPAITLMGSEETTDHSGIAVTIPINVSDINKFLTAARQVLMYFTPMPIFTGQVNFTPNIASYTLVNSAWKIRASDSMGPRVIQGFVGYPVNKEILTESVTDDTIKSMLQLDIDLIVPIGDAEVAPSREALSYDQRTSHNIAAALRKAANELRVTFQEEFNKCTTWIEAAHQYDMRLNDGSKLSSLFRAHHKETPFVWEGIPITNQKIIDLAGIKHARVVQYYLTFGARNNKRLAIKELKSPLADLLGQVPGSNHNQVEVVLSADMHIATFNKANASTQRNIREYLKTAGHGLNGRAVHMIAVIPTLSAKYNEAEHANLIAQLGNNPKHVPYVAATPQLKPRNKQDKTERLVFTGFTKMKTRTWGNSDKLNRAFSRNVWKRASIDLDAGGFYVPVDGFAIKHAMGYRVDRHVAAAHRIGLLEEVPELVGFTKDQQKEVAGNDKWVNIFDHIRHAYAKKDRAEGLTNRLIMHTALAHFGLHMFTQYITNWKSACTQVGDGPFYTYFKELNTIQQLSANVHIESLVELAGQLDKHKHIKVAGDLHTKFTTMCTEQYPLLPHIQWPSISTTSAVLIGHIQDYITAQAVDAVAC